MKRNVKTYYGMIYRYSNVNIFVTTCTLCRLKKGKAKMVLDRGQCYYINLSEDKFCIQLSFLLYGKHHSPQHRLELFQYILSTLKHLMKDFMQASTAPTAYVPCYYQDCDKLHVELQLLCDGEYQYCPTVEKPIPDDYYCDLFPNKGLLY